MGLHILQSDFRLARKDRYEIAEGRMVCNSTLMVSKIDGFNSKKTAWCLHFSFKYRRSGNLFSSASKLRCIHPGCEISYTYKGFDHFSNLNRFAEPAAIIRELLFNHFRARKAFFSVIVEGLNNKAKVTMRNAYDFQTFRILEFAIYHALIKLPKQKLIHSFHWQTSILYSC
jgi:hypothetical protein